MPHTFSARSALGDQLQFEQIGRLFGFRSRLPRQAQSVSAKTLPGAGLTAEAGGGGTRCLAGLATGMKFLLMLLLLMPLLAWPASFDCQKARSAVEKMVCADPELSKLDEQLEQTYHSALKALQSPGSPFDPKKNKDQLVLDQKDWVTYARNICEDAACLHKVYQTRINLLNSYDGSSYGWPKERFIDSGAELPDGVQEIIIYESNPNNETASFNQSIIDDSKRAVNDGKLGKLIGFNESGINKDEPGKIIGCSEQIQLPSGGTAPNAYTSAGICTFQKEKTRTLVRICSNEIFGNYVIEVISKINTSYKALATFAKDQCGVGG